MRSPTTAPIEIIPAGNTLGEGILWDSRREVLWWTDIQRRRLHRYYPGSGATQILDTPERVGSFGLVAGSEELITAFESGIAMYHPVGKDREVARASSGAGRWDPLQ